MGCYGHPGTAVNSSAYTHRYIWYGLKMWVTRAVTGQMMFKRTVKTNLSHHVGGGLPTACANVLVEGDVEMSGRFIVLDHIKQS